MAVAHDCLGPVGAWHMGQHDASEIVTQSHACPVQAQEVQSWRVMA